MRGGWKRRLLTGTNAALVTVAVVAIVALLVGLAGRYRLRVDLTEEAESTLLPETLAVLQVAEDREIPVEITAFSAQKRDKEAWYRDRVVRDLLRELEYASPMVETRFVDFDRERLAAESLGVTAYGTIVVEAAGDRVDIVERDVFRRRGRGAERTLEFLGEGAINRAISQVITREERTIYFLEGHGEDRVGQRASGGLQVLPGLLEDQGWTVEPLDLLRDRKEGEPPAVPDDGHAVLVVGPTAPMTPEEEQVLREYLGGGGRVGFFLDPGSFVPDAVERLGVVRPEGVVLDEVAIYPHQDRPLLRYGRHMITEDLLEANTATVVSHAAPLETESRDGVRADDLLVTSRRGWVERGNERPIRFDEGVDEPGPVVVALALEVRPPHPLVSRGEIARVLVSGDSDLLDDGMMAEGPGNATFAVNAVRWLVGEDERMSRVGRPTVVRRLALSQQQLTMIRWVVMALLPLLAVLAGAAMWATRRGR